MSNNKQSARLPVRAVAARVLARVRAGEGSLSEALPTADAQLSDPRDRAFLRLVVYQTLRKIYRREAALARLLERPLPKQAREIESLLLLALTQLDEGIDGDYAVVDASVEAARALGKPQLAALVNAVLRRVQRMGKDLYAADIDQAQLQFDHPQWMIDRFRADWPSECNTVLTENNARPPTWLRVNRRRTSIDGVVKAFADAGISSNTHPHLTDALEVRDAGDITQLPGWLEGHFSVQDIAAQLAIELLDPRPGMRVLDACAAPGGKLAHIAERVPELACLIGIDSDAERVERTREAMARLGLDPLLTHGDAAAPELWWDRQLFDRILIDAPCSGTGVIRRHPDIRLLRRHSDIHALVRQQAKILDGLWPLLVPGGRLVYATCSVFKEENEHQVATFLARHADARALPLAFEWFGRESGAGRQNLPGTGGADGFFYAAIQKNA